MKNLKFISMALVASMALLSCGGGDDPGQEPDPTPQPTEPAGRHLTQTCDMPAPASEIIITLRGLSTEIDRQTGQASWLTVARQPYTAGAPEVKVTVAENLQDDARQQDVTFIAAKDTLVLTVRQAAYDTSGGSNTDSPYDTPTDQPAY